MVLTVVWFIALSRFRSALSVHGSCRRSSCRRASVSLLVPAFSFNFHRYLLENLDWLQESLGDYEDDYLLIDCPGQIELYTHIPIMPRLIQTLTQANIRTCATYLLDSQFMEDKNKFFAGVLSAMSCMINLEVPHINILSKMDLVKNNSGASTKLKKEVDRYLLSDPMLLQEEALSETNPKFQALNSALVQLVSCLDTSTTRLYFGYSRSSSSPRWHTFFRLKTSTWSSSCHWT